MVKNRFMSNLRTTVVPLRLQAVKACKAGRPSGKHLRVMADYIAGLTSMRDWVQGCKDIVRAFLPALPPSSAPSLEHSACLLYVASPHHYSANSISAGQDIRTGMTRYVLLSHEGAVKDLLCPPPPSQPQSPSLLPSQSGFITYQPFSKAQAPPVPTSCQSAESQARGPAKAGAEDL